MSSPSSISRREFISLFEGAVEEAATALFTELEGLPIEPGSYVDDSAGVVGFVGEEIRGMFAVGITSEGPEEDRIPMRDDYAGELANRLAGRVKNLLSRSGFVYQVAPPATLHGSELAVAVTGSVTRLTFPGGDLAYNVYATVEFLEEGDEIRAGEAQIPVNEGEMLLF